MMRTKRQEGGNTETGGPRVSVLSLLRAWLVPTVLVAGRHSPSGIVKVNKEAIVPEFGEHLIMVAIHIACGSEAGHESLGQHAGPPILPSPLGREGGRLKEQFHDTSQSLKHRLPVPGDVS